jgi:hypothetical protein
MNPRDAGAPSTLLAEARRLIDSVPAGSEGVWARSAALLARQALEAAIRAKLAPYSARLDDAPFRAQLLCLQGVIGDSDVARQANYLWSALSSATHHCGYELAPTAAELGEWIAGVKQVMAILEQRSRFEDTGTTPP